eukprot:TRINITY_DN2178_c0_g2_i1.p1 TRINITY_DN2178_c0_g2~~TRINITY_DN2178_c0_g2_i1.p1  ORF type:complete len:555 (+),score=227.08 TRINITY_DN2178_c0_g2_i1:100-1764(+)
MNKKMEKKGKKWKEAKKEREEMEKKSVEKKKKKSLNEELMELVVPSSTYKDIDPDSMDSLTRNWKPNKNQDKNQQEEDENNNSSFQKHSHLKRKPSLRSVDDSLFHSKYAGKVISKKSLKDFSSDEEEDQQIEEEEDDDGDDFEMEGEEEGEEEEYEEEEDQKGGREKKVRKNKAERKIDRLFSGFGQDSEDDDDENEMNEFEESEGDEEEFGERFFGNEEEEDEEEEEKGDQSGSKPIKSRVLDEADELQRQLEEESEEPSAFKVMKNEENELEKAFHTRNQTNLFGNLMGLRIHMQNPLSLANRLPKSKHYHQFQNNKEIKDKLTEVNQSLMKLMEDFLEIKSCLKEQNEETNQYKRSKRPPPTDLDSLWNEIQEEEDSFKAFEEETIEKWNQRVLLSSGANAGKQFKAINQTVMNQVNNILEDSNRLIARTQTKRNQFHVFGTETGDDKLEKDEDIFDDGDFYQYLLKEVVESGSKDLDPLVFSQFLKENSRLNKKSKKHTASKSKGRLIQYETIEKLVGFMAPAPLPVNFFEKVERSQELFANLFGRRSN